MDSFGLFPLTSADIQKRLPGPSLLLRRPGSDLAAFAGANRTGGVHGRRLELISRDDGYEPTRAISNTDELLNQHKVFALIGQVGTPTARAVVPIAEMGNGCKFGGVPVGGFSVLQAAIQVALPRKAALHRELTRFLSAYHFSVYARTRYAEMRLERLENRQGGNTFVGSNPTLSAINSMTYEATARMQSSSGCTSGNPARNLAERHGRHG